MVILEELSFSRKKKWEEWFRGDRGWGRVASPRSMILKKKAIVSII
jgi:hypothetical protein